jgi:two-component system, response regulator FlrC
MAPVLASHPGMSAFRGSNVQMSRRDPVGAEPSPPSSGEALAAHPCHEPTEPAPLVGRTVADVERELILETLRHCRGNRTHAAKILGISLRTLRNKLHEFADAGMVIPEPHRPGH